MAGIYIHIPFCKQKCTYCDFHFSTTYEKYRSDMVVAIVKEIENRKDYLGKQVVKTIYFGGGTPSLLSKNELQKILSTIYKLFEVVNDVEISLEANPDDINPENLEVWKSEKINRLSIGLQSFKKSDLEWMNRAHSVEDAFQCVSLAQEYGFNNITVDLMYGLPDLTMEEWEKHIQQVIDFNVPHISAYCLTVEEKTTLSNWVEKGKIVPASEDQQSDQFLKLLEKLEANGYIQYEISNFSKKGFESIHNSNYWKGEQYLGVGPSAHSFNGKSRSWNIANNSKYIQAIQQNTEYNKLEVLTPENIFNEMILTGLRTIYGVDLIKLETILPIPDKIKEQVQEFIENSWMKKEDSIVYLTKKGRLRADFIASELFVV